MHIRVIISTGYGPRAPYCSGVYCVLLKGIEQKQKRSLSSVEFGSSENLCAKMAEAKKYRIPLFDGSNFGNWKFGIEMLLIELELLELTERPYTERVTILPADKTAEKEKKEKLLVEWAKKDRKCRFQIIQRIADSHLEYVKDKIQRLKSGNRSTELSREKV